jgi:putative ABC transport system permease protein
VELGMTLSGVSGKEKRERAIEVLKQVGLKDHLHKKPNQLSGGQMQRVAIARALANNPEILLCDEPTGALDSATSKQIMDLIRELSKERLVIMVTHNAEIAEGYADRMIKFEDGVVVSDSNPHIERPKPDMFNLKKTAMSFITALNLSGNNILTKKGRTFLTAFASSIGIIGIAVILSLSNGFQLQIDKFQEEALSEFPILITPEIAEFNHDEFHEQIESSGGRRNRDVAAPTHVTVFDPSKFYSTHYNHFSDEYIEFLENVDPEICSSVGYVRLAGINVLRHDADREEDDGVASIVFPTVMTMMSGSMSFDGGTSMGAMMNAGLSAYPKTLGNGLNYLERNYELLHGRFPNEPTDLVMVIGRNGRLTVHVLEQLGFDTERESISFDEILDTKFRMIHNNDFYNEISDLSVLMPEIPDDFDLDDVEALEGMDIPEGFELPEGMEFDLAEMMEIPEGMVVDMEMSEESEESQGFDEPMSFFVPNTDLWAMWDSGDSVELKIVGIIRQSADSSMGLLSNGLAYSDELNELVIERAQESDIVKAQLSREESVFPGMPGVAEEIPRNMLLSILGATTVPNTIMLYPSSFEKKDLLLEYLDSWNEGKVCICDDEEHGEDCRQIIYTDMAGMILGFMSEIISAVTIVLIAFAAISLVVSLIMIAIITYISVLERTKEIGILRALGARKKDITRVFDAETFIIGAFSGLIGVFIAWLLTFPANWIIEDMTNLPDVAQLSIVHAISLLILSTTLTVLGGHLPARMASRRDAVEALRSE